MGPSNEPPPGAGNPKNIGDLASNVISDFGPILALFGEQVAKQFMSQSTSWVDNVVFAMAPVGIITAIVGAIRIAGPGWLKAIVGRARESRAVAEVELMSSTSHEVCEMWDGHNVVRIMGAPEIRELIYLDSIGGENLTKENKCQLYSLDGDDWKDVLAKDSEGLEVKQRSAPNISMNIHNYVSSWESQIAAVVGILLQAAVLVYAYLSTYNSSLKIKLETPEPFIWAWYLTLIGTMAVASGMFGCSYIIDKSTNEVTYTVKSKGVRIIWLQRGTTVNDQVFKSYAINTSGRQSILTSRRNPNITNQETPSHVFEYITTASSFFSVVGFIMQFMGLRGMHWSVPVAQVLAAIMMTILRVVIRRGLSKRPSSQPLPPDHENDWLALSIVEEKTTLEDQLRHELNGNELPPKSNWWDTLQVGDGTKTDLMEINNCDWRIVTDTDRTQYEFLELISPFTVVTNTDETEYESLELISPAIVVTDTAKDKAASLARRISARVTMDASKTKNESPVPSCPGIIVTQAQQVMETRKRLGLLTQWPSAYSATATSLATAIELVMNAIPGFAEDGQKKGATWEVLWPMNVRVSREANDTTTLHFKLTRFSGSGVWEADLAEIEAALSLCLYSMNRDIPSTSQKIHRSRADEWLRSGKASRKQTIRHLGPSSSLSRRDMCWWMGGGLGQVLELDLAESRDDIGNRTIKSGIVRFRAMGFGAKELLDGVYTLKTLATSSEQKVMIENMNRHGLPSATLPRDPRDLQAQPGGQKLLVTISEAPLDLLFAQEIFSSFIWALAKSSKVKQIGGETIVHHRNDASSTTTSTSITLENTELAKLVQDVEGTGLGSIDEIYMTILPAFIWHRKLPDPGAVVDYIHEVAKRLMIAGYWEKAAANYLWAFGICNYHSHEQSSTDTNQVDDCLGDEAAGCCLPQEKALLIKATAALTEFMRSLTTEGARLVEQKSKKALETAQVFGRLRAEITLELNKSLGTGWLLRRLERMYRMQGRPEGYESWGTGPDNKLISPTPDELRNTSRTKAGAVIRERLVNTMDSLGWTALHYAVACGDSVSIELLVAAGADWGQQDLAGWAPLHYAAASRENHLIWSHVRSVADINAQARNGYSALHCAARSNNYNTAKMLIECGANIHIYDNYRQTPLHWAAFKGSTRLIHLFMGYRASTSAVDDFGRTPLHLAVIRGSPEIVASLFPGSDIEGTDQDGNTAFKLAASALNLPIMKVLLKNGANVNPESYHGITLLHTAAMAGHKELVQFLLEHKADPNTTDDQGRTLLQEAARAGHTEVVELLIKNNVEVDKVDQSGRSALHQAAWAERIETVKLLLENEADINKPDRRGWTALLKAAEAGHTKIVELLLQEQADVQLSIKGGYTALHLAAKRGREEVVVKLLEYRVDVNLRCDDGNSALHLAAMAGHKRVVELLLEQADVNNVNSDGDTALHKAVSAGKQGVVRVLLANKADVDKPNNKCNTALHEAAWEEDIQVVELLLEAKANINAKGESSDTVLRAAIVRQNKDLLKIVLQKRVNVKREFGDGQTPLEMARQSGNKELVRMLLEAVGTDNAV